MASLNCAYTCSLGPHLSCGLYREDLIFLPGQNISTCVVEERTLQGKSKAAAGII
jgi:hypothetical protein